MGRIAALLLLISSLLVGSFAGGVNPVAAAAGTVDVRSTAQNDSVEQRTNDGYMYRTSSDLEFFNDGAIPQAIGVRFRNVIIPEGATITSSWIEFTAKGSSSGSTQFTIRGDASTSPPEYGGTNFSLTNRPTTGQSTSWAPGSWSSGTKQQTPSLNGVVQEVLDGPWQSGNAMAFNITGSGSVRRAFTTANGAANAPRLQIAYTTDPGGPQSVNVRVSTGSDDVEERLSNGAMSSGSTDLELIRDSSNDQMVGLRFRGVNVPAGVTITNAWLEFEVDEVSTGASSLTIRGQRTGNAGGFTSAAGNLSSRTATSASTAWSPGDWSTVNAKHRTPAMTSVVQEIVSLNNWSAGNSMVFMVSGSGRRAAESYNGEAAAAPLLHIEYQDDPAPVPSPFVINEIYQQGPSADHWVELYNTSDQPADLFDHQICTNIDCNLITTSTIVPAGGLYVMADLDVFFVAPGRVRIYDERDDAPIRQLDEYVWTALAPTSYGRCPDGTGDMQVTTSVTEGTANDCSPPVGMETVEVRVANGADDAEERVATGAISSGSTDLELTRDGNNNQEVGIRFQGVDIPAGASIIDAWVEFEVDEVSTGASSVTIHGERSANAAGFTSSPGNLSGRTATSASVGWSPPDWTAVNAKQQTPSLTSVVQEIVSVPGWSAGNSMAFMLSGSGRRTAESFNGEAAAAPMLHVEFMADAAASPFVINEVFMQGPGADHWVEMINTSGQPANVLGHEVCSMIDCNLIENDVVVPGGGIWVMQDLDVYFSGQSRVRLYAPREGNARGERIDEYEWTTLAATSYGRCPDGNGPMTLTLAATEGTANSCTPIVPPSGSWPGSGTVANMNQLSGDNWSGLAYEASGANSGVLWAVRNGPSTLVRISRAGGGWGGTTNYTVPGNLDTEAVTAELAGDNLVYLGVERDNDQGGTADNMIVQYNTSSNSARQWRLTGLNAGVNANKGIEALAWIPDTDLGALAGYNPANHPNHRTGVFVVGMESGPELRFYTLDHSAGSNGHSLVHQVDSGLQFVMGMEYDSSTGLLWATCDNTCTDGKRAALLALDAGSGQFELLGTYGAPSGHNSYNNEGYAVLPTSECSGGSRPAVWSEDGGSNPLRQVSTTIGC
ncbi:MAG: SdiA-regulated domain-containing protein [Acidimicrobiales bacterium]